MRLVPCGVAALLLVQLSSCDFLRYEPSGEYEVNLDPSATPAIDVDFSAPGDTLGAWGNATFYYHFDLEGRTFIETHVYLDGELLLTTQNREYFTVDTRTLSNGSHSFVIEVRAQSGTGSLADRFGAEVAFVRREKVLVVDNALPHPVGVRTIGPAAGRLQVTWQPYSRANFQSYVLYRARGYTGYDGSVQWLSPEFVALINDARTTTWTDSTYVGDHVRFHVEVRAAEKSAVGSTTSFFSTPPHLLGAEAPAGDQLRLTWSSSPFFANFSHYVISRSSGSDYGWTHLTTLAHPDDTTFVDAGPHLFGSVYRYRIRTVARSEHSAESPEYTAWLGSRAPVGNLDDLPRYVPAHGVYLARTDGMLVLLDGVSHEVVARYRSEGAAAPSSNGLFFTSVEASFDQRATLVRRHDPATLAPVQSYELRPVVGDDQQAILVAATDAKQLFLRTSEIRGYTAHCCTATIVDLDPIRLVARLGTPEQPATFVAVSPQGRYALVHQNHGYDASLLLYAVREEDVQEAGMLPHTSYVQATFIEEDLLVVLDRATLYVYRVPHLQLERSFAVASALEQLDYDPVSGYLGGFADGVFYTYDSSNGSQVAAVDVAPEGSYTLTNGTLWSLNGFARPLLAND